MLPRTVCSVRVSEAAEQLRGGKPPCSPSLLAAEPTFVVVGHSLPLGVVHYSPSVIVFVEKKVDFVKYRTRQKQNE